MTAQKDLSNGACEGLAVIRINGTDRRSFLQGQLTQDIDRLAPETPLLAGWVSVKGRLRCLVWVADWGDAIWLILPHSLADHVARQLAMFVLRADVQIDTPETVVCAVPLSEAAKLSTIKVNSDIGDLTTCFYSDSYLLIRVAQLPETGLLLCAPRDVPASATDWSAWRLENIRAGLPSVWPGSVDMFVPQMLNLDLLDAISFTKGCYVGQEIVARTQNLGRIKRRMYGFVAEGDHHVAPGAALYSDGRKSGEVVDAVSSNGRTELLAVVPIEKLTVPLSPNPGDEIQLERIALPYPVPEELT